MAESTPPTLTAFFGHTRKRAVPQLSSPEPLTKRARLEPELEEESIALNEAKPEAQEESIAPKDVKPKVEEESPKEESKVEPEHVTETETDTADTPKAVATPAILEAACSVTWVSWKKDKLMHEPLLSRLQDVAPDWVDALGGDDEVETMLRITSTKLLHAMSRTPRKAIFPPFPSVFRAYQLLRPEDVKVVILGQDPYPKRGDAHGLAFSKATEGIPASLRNIFKEIKDSLGVTPESDANLERWVRQGVLLINTDLTVPEGLAGKHKGCWEPFTSAVLRYLSERTEGVAFVLWGRNAQTAFDKVVSYVDTQHLKLEGVHPSPMSARNGFFGCNHFGRINEWLAASGRATIDWS